MQNNIHINFIDNYINSQEPLIRFLILGQNGLVNLLFSTSNSTVVYYNISQNVKSITQIHLQEAINVSVNCNIIQNVIALNSEKFVLLPIAISEPFAQKNAVNLMHDVAPNELLLVDSITWQGINNVYTIKPETLDYLHTLMAEPKVVNLYSAILNNAFKTKSKLNNQVFVHFESNSLCITVFVNDILQLHNVYDITEANDVLYYIQKTITKLQLNEIEFKISGFSIDSYTQLLSSTYSNVNQANLPNGVINSQLSASEQQQLFSVYCLINQCV